MAKRDLTTEYRHTPVLANEVIEGLNLKSNFIFVDCTLGGAGHTMLAAQHLGEDAILIGIDEDPMAIEAATKNMQESFEHLDFRPMQGNFVDLDKLLVKAQIPWADAILMDLGLSSPQIDFPERGFSYKVDAPLDMRRNPGKHTPNAAEIIATKNEEDLARIIREYGEERWASRIAKFIVAQRQVEPILTTLQLVEVIKAAIPASARKSGGHPAKRTFQALRIEVNHELEELAIALESALRWLRPGGRVALISYHSLEDRIVKDFFASFAMGCICPPDMPVCTCKNSPKLKIITKKPITPTPEELEHNSRAKSAKLRIAQRV